MELRGQEPRVARQLDDLHQPVMGEAGEPQPALTVLLAGSCC